jgi:hypothetical protein
MVINLYYLVAALARAAVLVGFPYVNHNGLWPSVPYSVRNVNLVVKEHVYV